MNTFMNLNRKLIFLAGFLFLSLSLFGFVAPVEAQTISSEANQSFTVGDTATDISTITITDDVVKRTIKANKDIRIRIPSTFNMTWDTSITTVTIGGGASGKVNTTLKNYEDGNKTLVIDVANDFAAGDQITVSGAKFADFGVPSSADNLELDVDDDQVGDATDDKTITIVAGATANITSAADQIFNVDQTATAISTITVCDASSATITLTNDIRIRIPSTFNMTWDTSDTTATIGGNASAKVSTTVSYEDSNQTLVLDVTSDFVSGDYITVSDLSFTSFTAVSSADNLEMEVDNLGTVADTDDKTMVVNRYGLSSEANQSFTVGDTATDISTITITDDVVKRTIKANKDIRIRIPSTFNMTWDTSITTVTIGGGASGKVNTTLKNYEDGNKTLVIDVANDFAAGDQITVSGAKFADFGVPSSADNLELDVDDDQVGDATDDKTIVILPSFADIIVVKSFQTFSDPYNGETNPKAIPGGVMLYTIIATNQGAGATDANTVVLTDPIPANTALFVGDIDGPGPATGPVLFTDGTPPDDSGLSYTFTSLDSLTDDVAFSNDGGTTYTYIPVPDADGFDTNVTHLRINPKGTFNAASGGDIPTFEVKFKVRVE